MWASGSSSTDSREFSYEFYTSNLELLPHSNFSNVNTYSPNNITIYCTTVGNLEKIIYYYFESDGEMVSERSDYQPVAKETQSASGGQLL